MVIGECGSKKRRSRLVGTQLASAVIGARRLQLITIICACFCVQLEQCTNTITRSRTYLGFVASLVFRVQRQEAEHEQVDGGGHNRKSEQYEHERKYDVSGNAIRNEAISSRK